MTGNGSRYFKDRKDAGRQLAIGLLEAGIEASVVLGIPRGGVIVSAEVAGLLGASHGVVVARKLGSPLQPELAIGAVTASGVAWLDDDLIADLNVSERYLARETLQQADLARTYEASFDGQLRPGVEGLDVLIVDDGVATGATAIAAIRAVRQEGASLVMFAVPVGPPQTIDRLRHEADLVFCLHAEDGFVAVGQYYRHFAPVEEQDVARALDIIRKEQGWRHRSDDPSS
jgi:putative phosphoribosyl transferase